MIIRTIMFFITFFSLIFCFFDNNVNAVIFFNMDKAGGDKAISAQKHSATAAAIFLLSASDVFKVFAEIEYLNSDTQQKPDGEKPSIGQAKDFCGSAIKSLNKSLGKFKNLPIEHPGSIQSINAALDKKIENPAFLKKVFDEAHVRMDGTIAQSVMNAYKANKMAALIEIILKQISNVLVEMNNVKSELDSNQIPKDTTLWKASFRWNETFYMGRVFSAFFKIK